MKLQKIIAVCVVGLLLSGIVFAEPVAMVTDVGGTVSTLENGKVKKVELLSYLEPNMVLQLDSKSFLSVTFLSKPVEYRFSGPARLTVEQDKISTGDGKAEAHTISLQKTTAAKRFTVAQRESVTQAAFEMRSIKRPGLRLTDPVDTSLIDGNALAFSWDGPHSGGGYQLSLYENHTQLLYQTSVTSNSWTPTPGLLKAGNSYEWEVKSALENGEVLTARGNFSVADEDTAKSVQEQSPQVGNSFSDRVLYAVYLEENGFKYDARRLWKELAKERPDDVVARDHSIR